VIDQTAAAELVGANPGPAVHLAVLGIVVVVALVVVGIVRWRNKREAAQAKLDSSPPDRSLEALHSADEEDRAPS